jgi:hypothetical protein
MGSVASTMITRDINTDIEDNVFNQECVQWLLSPGSELYPAARQLAIGRVIAVLAYECVREYQMHEISTMGHESGADVFTNLAHTLYKMAVECSFDRTVDWYLEAMMRTKLQAARMAYLRPSVKPMRALPEEIRGQDTNKLVRGFMRFKPSARFDAADWKYDYSTELYVTCIALFREISDDVIIPLCTNNEIACHQDHGIPAPFVLTGNFPGSIGSHIGFVHETVMYTVHPSADHPVLRTLLAWCECCISATESDGNKSAPFRSFYNAAISPDRILPGDKYAKFFRV